MVVVVVLHVALNNKSGHTDENAQGGSFWTKFSLFVYWRHFKHKRINPFAKTHRQVCVFVTRWIK